MAIERIVDTSSHADDSEEQRIEVTLRPQRFAEYVGQERLKKNLQLAIAAAKKRGEPIDHVLLYGPPGLGKTTMAAVIANEIGAGLRVTSGPAIEKAGDLASILTNLNVVYRRDPPLGAGCGRDLILGDGGLQARYRHWQRAGGPQCSARPTALYGNWRDDTDGEPGCATARPIWAYLSFGILHPRGDCTDYHTGSDHPRDTHQARGVAIALHEGAPHTTDCKSLA